MELYFGRFSGNSARSAFALKEAGAPFTPRPIRTPGADAGSAWYRALNPMGKVPTLVDGDLCLWESNAINWYVAERHPEAQLLPTSLSGRASVQRWLLFQTGQLTPPSVTVFRGTNQHVQRIWSASAEPSAVDAARHELARYFAVLEAALEHREWLEGHFSLADVAFAPHCWLLAQGGFDFSRTPRVKAWLERLWGRPAWKAAVDLALSPQP